MRSSALAVATSAAKEAGKILLDAYRTDEKNTVKFKRFNEPVTLADYASNDLIVRRLTKAFPKDEIVSEEAPCVAEGVGTKTTWVIDPLDGTSNFIAHIPFFAVTIAHVKNGNPVLGVIYDPVHDDLYVAERGNGARLNGNPIRTSSRDVTRGAMLFAGRGYRDHDRIRHGKIIYALERRTPYFRRLGSAAIMLAGVATGRADAVILTGSKPWDTLAGVLLIEEAGGKVSDYRGRKWSHASEDLVATNGPIHPTIVKITRKRMAV